MKSLHAPKDRIFMNTSIIPSRPLSHPMPTRTYNNHIHTCLIHMSITHDHTPSGNLCTCQLHTMTHHQETNPLLFSAAPLLFGPQALKGLFTVCRQEFALEGHSLETPVPTTFSTNTHPAFLLGLGPPAPFQNASNWFPTDGC